MFFVSNPRCSILRYPTSRAPTLATRDLVICSKDIHEIGQGLGHLGRQRATEAEATHGPMALKLRMLRTKQVDGVILLTLEVETVYDLCKRTGHPWQKKHSVACK